jgi:hypothetical protein
MSLDKTDHEDFSSENPMPNIWNINDEDQNKKKDDAKPTVTEEQDSDQEVVTSGLEEELERPSFLRRLSRHHHDTPNESKNDSNREEP